MTQTAAGQYGWRLPRPAPTDLVIWPEGFGRRFIVFVDTEEEFDWSAPFSRDARSVESIAALPAMHRRLADHGVAPCYLCDYPVVADARAAGTLRTLLEDGRCSVGAQLHPWVNPPHDEHPSVPLSFAGNLPRALEAAKLDRLTGAITQAVGQAPRAYRAGRYGLGPNTAGLLAERGYRIDTSVRAHHDYSREGGPDFGRIGADAFRIGPTGTVVELPLTTIYTGARRRRGAALHRAARRMPYGRGLLARAGLVSRVPLTPEGVSAEEAGEAIRIAAAEGPQLLTISFHSPSLVPGNTPYVRDADDLARFHRWWDTILALLRRLDLRPASLDEVIAAIDEADGA